MASGNVTLLRAVGSGIAANRAKLPRDLPCHHHTPSMQLVRTPGARPPEPHCPRPYSHAGRPARSESRRPSPASAWGLLLGGFQAFNGERLPQRWMRSLRPPRYGARLGSMAQVRVFRSLAHSAANRFPMRRRPRPAAALLALAVGFGRNRRSASWPGLPRPSTRRRFDLSLALDFFITSAVYDRRQGSRGGPGIPGLDPGTAMTASSGSPRGRLPKARYFPVELKLTGAAPTTMLRMVPLPRHSPSNRRASLQTPCGWRG